MHRIWCVHTSTQGLRPNGIIPASAVWSCLLERIEWVSFSRSQRQFWHVFWHVLACFDMCWHILTCFDIWLEVSWGAFDFPRMKSSLLDLSYFQQFRQKLQIHPGCSWPRLFHGICHPRLQPPPQGFCGGRLEADWTLTAAVCSTRGKRWEPWSAPNRSSKTRRSKGSFTRAKDCNAASLTWRSELLETWPLNKGESKLSGTSFNVFWVSHLQLVKIL